MGLIGWLLVALAWADRAPQTVRSALADDVAVDWTLSRLEVSATGRHETFRTDLALAEQEAMDRVAARIGLAIEGVPVREGLEAARIAEVVARAGAAWTVVETRYHPDGRVDVVGAVDLRDVFGPWMASRAVVPPTQEAPVRSGVLLDARGMTVRACYAPRVLGADSVTRMDAALWLDVAGGTPPAVWVTTPADPRGVAVAGADPVMLRVEAVEGCTLWLGADATAAWDREVAGTRLTGEGRVLIVAGG